MSDKLTIAVESEALFDALDALGVSADAHVLAAAEVTGRRVADEARARVRRRTGETARGITVEQAKVGIGVVVFVDRPDEPGVPSFLEFGTKFQTATPFLFNSARLEEGAHTRRMVQALQDAIDDSGFK
jgi:hypothetical protein